MCVSLITLITALVLGTTSGILVERYLAKQGHKPENKFAKLQRWFKERSTKVTAY
ncbi:MAG: hypothetical protein ACRCYY_20355 [Trueperaceae bacterium]